MNPAIHDELRRSCTLPDAYAGSVGLLELRHEEDCTTWFWAFPDLWPWPEPVTWIHTPVSGDGCGDLWGIDRHGELLVIECKKRWASNKDPFEDFVVAVESARDAWGAAALLTRWSRGLRAERALHTPLAPNPSGDTTGLLPRSNHRQHIARWPRLAALAGDDVRSADYERRVRQALAAREDAGNPPPHFFGLIATKNLDLPPLTGAGIASAAALRSRGGARGTVGLVIAHGRPIDDGQVLLAARRIPDAEWGTPPSPRTQL